MNKASVSVRSLVYNVLGRCWDRYLIDNLTPLVQFFNTGWAKSKISKKINKRKNGSLHKIYLASYSLVART